MEKKPVEIPWCEGYYKTKGGFVKPFILTNDRLVTFLGPKFEMKLKFGDFGEVDAKIGEQTGAKNFNIEVSFNAMGKDMKQYGVLVEEGKKFFVNLFGGLMEWQWVPEEEGKELAKDGDPIEAPPSHHKVQPEYQGRLIWITGPPGLGKSTSAQLLSREHGFVYYEGDCFSQLRNPYIPSDVKNPSLASQTQRLLVGEGTEKRREVGEKAVRYFADLTNGDNPDEESIKDFYRELCKDIKRERARLGGDWAIATVITSRSLRDFVRQELGPNLEIAVLEMTLEQQMERVSARHKGDEQAVEMLKGWFRVFEPVQKNEPNTASIKVTPDMTPFDVMSAVLKTNN